MIALKTRRETSIRGAHINGGETNLRRAWEANGAYSLKSVTDEQQRRKYKQPQKMRQMHFEDTP